MIMIVVCSNKIYWMVSLYYNVNKEIIAWILFTNANNYVLIKFNINIFSLVFKI